MDILLAPWRMGYILQPKSKECLFCIPENQEKDASGYILARGRLCFVLMNRYPYTNGHLLVVPFRHVADLADISDEESSEAMFWLRSCVAALRKALKPDGINIGLNLGEVAGAGIANHLHFHVVPRWQGDTSFMTVCAETRILPEGLSETYAKLAPFFTPLPTTTT
jgi:ATP adenylyltransferase